MLSRLTPGVRAVVARAYRLAQRDGLQQIGEGPLLWALLDDEQGGVLLAKVVGASERAQVADEMEQARRRGGVTEGEADALAGFGIDVDAVVGQIEEQMGVGALAGSGPSTARRWNGPLMSARSCGRWRRRSGISAWLAAGRWASSTWCSGSFRRRGSCPSHWRVAGSTPALSRPCWSLPGTRVRLDEGRDTGRGGDRGSGSSDALRHHRRAERGLSAGATGGSSGAARTERGGEDYDDRGTRRLPCTLRVVGG